MSTPKAEIIGQVSSFLLTQLLRIKTDPTRKAMRTVTRIMRRLEKGKFGEGDSAQAIAKLLIAKALGTDDTISIAVEEMELEGANVDQEEFDTVKDLYTLMANHPDQETMKAEALKYLSSHG